MKNSFDSTEILHIVVSIVTISLAFSLFKDETFSPEAFWLVFLTVGVGFVLHELAHKYVALSFGAHAYYRAFLWGLFLALVLAFATNGSLVFAAPGAVLIHGRITREQYGKISLAGPLANLILAFGFLVLASTTGMHELGTTGAYVNAFLGIFNMLPFGPLDGAHVMAWDRRIWGLATAAFVLLFFLF
ncbi:hypothetical protein HZC09_04910 [Candidatus Micrarchaeota archaeon]|nr:hypothetical protein [Candidatus Micrarchaeota archaeon]